MTGGNLEPPRALLFDWDNTLVDTWSVIHSALETTFRALGLEPWTLAECRERVRGSARDVFPGLFGPNAGKATEIFYAAFGEIHLQQLQPLPGATALVERLAAAGHHLGVVSNKQGTLLRKEAAHLGWDRYFNKLVGATDAHRDKPAPDPALMALEGSGIAPGERVWFIGDTDVDLLCAVNCGCVPILLRPEAPGEGEFADCPPRRHVRSCEELAELLVL